MTPGAICSPSDALAANPKATKSQTNDRTYDSNGKLTSATVTLAKITGHFSESRSMDPDNYPFGSKITKDAELQVYVIGHELAHVEDAQTPQGRAAQDVQQGLASLLGVMKDVEGTRRMQDDPVAGSLTSILNADAKRNENVADDRAKGIVESFRQCTSKTGCP